MSHLRSSSTELTHGERYGIDSERTLASPLVEPANEEERGKESEYGQPIRGVKPH